MRTESMPNGSADRTVPPPGHEPPPADAVYRARRQLRRVLRTLALLDVSVVVLVVLLAVAKSALQWSTEEFLILVLSGIVLVLAARVALAISLRRKAGGPA